MTRRRIRRSARLPGDMWIWFAVETFGAWAIAAAFLFTATDWPLWLQIAPALLLLPVAFLVVRQLNRWVGE